MVGYSRTRVVWVFEESVESRKVAGLAQCRTRSEMEAGCRASESELQAGAPRRTVLASLDTVSRSVLELLYQGLADTSLTTSPGAFDVGLSQVRATNRRAAVSSPHFTHLSRDLSESTGAMAQVPDQMIHRDPQLLYASRARIETRRR